MSRTGLYKVLSKTTEPIRYLSGLNPLTIHKKGTRAKAIFALALVCFLWGTTWVASKEGVRYMPALQMAGIRQFLGGLCYVAFFLIKGVPLPKGKEWWPIIILSVLNFLLSNGLSTWGLKYISAGLGAIMGAIFPLWVVIIGLFSSNEKVPAKAVLGLLAGFAGVCIIFYEHLADFANPAFLFGVLLSLIATWSWAFATIYTKKQVNNFNPYYSLGLQMVLSGTVLFFFTMLTDTEANNSFIPLKEIPLHSWLSIAYLVVFGSVISFIAYLYALKHLPAGQTSIYAYINPIVALLLGWALFGEHLTIFIGIGGVVTLLGVYMVNKAFKIKVPPAEKAETEGV